MININYDGITLRLLREEDLDQYVKWYSIDTEWSNWDAPWEPIEKKSKEDFRQYLNYQFYEGIPKRLQIIYQNELIGWVNTYFIDGDKNKRAIGIDIPPQKYRGMGLGQKAFKLWIKYLYSQSKVDELYCETWSGNIRMVKLALKCGFVEVKREKDKRLINKHYYDGLLFKIHKNE